MLEAKNNEEKESEVDGEVEERVTNVRMRHGDDCGMNEAQTRDLESACVTV